MKLLTIVYTALSLMLIMSVSPSSAIMKPESSMLLINEADGGGSINVENMAEEEALLYVKITDLPDDPQPKLLVTQPVSRVSARKTQRVRFILKSDQPLEHEHLKRATFEGISPKTTEGNNEISLNIRHNIPVIIHPKGLPFIADPWKDLEWFLSGSTLTVKNPGKYVVRLSQNIKLLPSGSASILDKSYILPGQMISIQIKDHKVAEQLKKVSIETLSKYGYETGTVEMPVSQY
ncbi:putative fimbrial chaperone protein [Serratia quinivorans]|uniref:fimbria/pilus chaperone family protein n=1 Tax=Serratia quinivorans TaxID=137545 RepID=UPI000D959F79|nr:fimbria/pilus chaperone family protein [Serratia quinivorans]SPZ61742.1 putative fimbrial chaperone protein [Serratia quinivorans]VEI63969.1 putative fimbrial chaperone protein [Serratia quinivorans]